MPDSDIINVEAAETACPHAKVTCCILINTRKSEANRTDGKNGPDIASLLQTAELMRVDRELSYDSIWVNSIYTRLKQSQRTTDGSSSDILWMQSTNENESER